MPSVLLIDSQEHPVTSESSGFGGMLGHLAQQKATGMLSLKAEELHTIIYLREGVPVFAEHGTMRESLGRVLVRDGRITQEQLGAAIHQMTENIVTNEGMRLGEVLVHMGALTGQEVFDALHRQTREKLIHCFQWPEVTGRFSSGVEHLEGIGMFKCPVPCLLYEGITKHYDHHRLMAIIKTTQDAGVPELTDTVENLACEFKFPQKAHQLLCHLSMAETLRSAIKTDDDAAVLVALLLVGCVRFIERAPPEETKPQQLKATETSFEKRRNQFMNIKRTRVSTAIRSMTSADKAAVKKLNTVEFRRVQASAEKAFQKGVQELEQNILPKALEHFRMAVEQMPNATEYALHCSFVEFLMAQGSQSQALATKTEKLALRALSQDRRMMSAHRILGLLMKSRGDDEGALKHFRYALKIAPDDYSLEREIRLLRMRADKKKKGLFGL